MFSLIDWIYIVNELDIQNRVEIYNSTQEEITFDLLLEGVIIKCFALIAM